MSSVFLGQKSRSTASKNIFTNVLSLSNKGIGLSHPPVEDKPSRNPFSVKGNSKVTNYSFIQHLSEIRYLDQQKLLRSIPAAITNRLTELKPGGIPQISAGERMRLLDDYLGSPYYSFLPRWKKERMAVGGITSSSGSHARAVGALQDDD